MSFLIAFTALWVLWLTLSRRSRRRLQYPMIALAAIVFFFSPLGMAVSSWGLTIALPTDSGEPVDAIVVLGRGDELRDRRIAEAWELWKANRASVIFASGMSDARIIVDTLQEMGIPSSTLKGEECSQSTTENGQFTSALLYRQGVRTILLVTDSAHSWRSLLTFRRFGFTVISHPVELSNTLSSFQRAAILLREYAGLISYVVTGKLKPLSEQELQSPPASVTGKIQEWNCSIGNI